jgi:TonB family protein
MKYKQKKWQASFFFSACIHFTAVCILACSASGFRIPDAQGRGDFQKITFSIGQITVSPLPVKTGEAVKIENRKEIPPITMTEKDSACMIGDSRETAETSAVDNLSNRTSQDKNEAAAEKTAPCLKGDAGTSPETGFDAQEALNYVIEIRRRIQESSYYPLQAKALGIEGQVVMAFHVDVQGYVTNLRMLSPAPYDILNKAAARIIENSTPLPVPPRDFNYLIRVPVTFKIRDS